MGNYESEDDGAQSPPPLFLMKNEGSVVQRWALTSCQCSSSSDSANAVALTGLLGRINLFPPRPSHCPSPSRQRSNRPIPTLKERLHQSQSDGAEMMSLSPPASTCQPSTCKPANGSAHLAPEKECFCRFISHVRPGKSPEKVSVKWWQLIGRRFSCLRGRSAAEC